MENFELNNSRRKVLNSRQRKKLKGKHGSKEKEQLLAHEVKVIFQKKVLDIRQSKREAATKTNSQEADG